MATAGHLLVIGLGYCGRAIAEAARDAGFQVSGTSRQAALQPPRGVVLIPFAEAGGAIASATHLVATAAPGAEGDPALAHYRQALAAAPGLRWIGFLSSTGVYGDRGGAWVDEAAEPRPSSARARARRAAEEAWAAFAAERALPLDLIRLAGIYGPGRSAFDDLRAGRARRIAKPGHAFGRIHRTDIAEGTLAALLHPGPAGEARVLNFNDDLPTEPAEVVAEAARMLGLPPPPLTPFEEAAAGMSEMGRSFWAESRRVSSIRTQAALRRPWRFPTYREGLADILARESAGHSE
ncbi:NAD-dependent epimerase/dehydratase family protein [Acidisoma sp. C75]